MRPHHIADCAGEERVVGTPKQQRVNVCVTNWGQHSFDQDSDFITDRLAPLNKFDKTGARRAGQVDRRTGAGNRFDVGTGRHGADGSDHADPTRCGRLYQRPRAGFNHVDHRHR